MINRLIKIYVWQIVSIIFNFGSVFVVTPYLSSNPGLFGIYSLVTAAYIFLSYADLGFFSAGTKYAAESFARKDRIEEMRVIGFTSFVFLIFSILYAAVILRVSFNPELLVKGLNAGRDHEIASELLIILALSSPVFVLQRMLQMIFAIRLEDYVFQRIMIVSSALKIVFAVIFFSKGGYPIVEYFLFSQVCSLLAVLAGILVAYRRLNYDVLYLLRSVRFSGELFRKTKDLAFVSLFLSLCWVLYFELDPMVISKLLGADKLATYTIGLTLMGYFRSVFGIFFSPFTARFNHFIGVNDLPGLKAEFRKVLAVAVPLTVFPILAVALTLKSFILCWVGPLYLSSVQIARMLILGYLFSFIISPAGILVMAYKRVSLLYLTSAVLPVIYWVGIFFTYRYSGLQAFANFKFLAFFLVTIVYCVIISRLLEIDFRVLIRETFAPIILPALLIVLIALPLNDHLPVVRAKLNLLIYFAVNGGIILSATVAYYFFSKYFRDIVQKLVGSAGGKWRFGNS